MLNMLWVLRTIVSQKFCQVKLFSCLYRTVCDEWGEKIQREDVYETFLFYFCVCFLTDRFGLSYVNNFVYTHRRATACASCGSVTWPMTRHLIGWMLDEVRQRSSASSLLTDADSEFLAVEFFEMLNIFILNILRHRLFFTLNLFWQ